MKTYAGMAISIGLAFCDGCARHIAKYSPNGMSETIRIFVLFYTDQ